MSLLEGRRVQFWELSEDVRGTVVAVLPAVETIGEVATLLVLDDVGRLHTVAADIVTVMPIHLTREERQP